MLLDDSPILCPCQRECMFDGPLSDKENVRNASVQLTSIKGCGIKTRKCSFQHIDQFPDLLSAPLHSFRDVDTEFSSFKGVCKINIVKGSLGGIGTRNPQIGGEPNLDHQPKRQPIIRLSSPMSDKGFFNFTSLAYNKDLLEDDLDLQSLNDPYFCRSFREQANDGVRDPVAMFMSM